MKDKRPESPTSTQQVVQTRNEIAPIQQLVAKAEKAIQLTERLSKSVVVSNVSNLVLAIALSVATYTALNKDTIYFSVTETGVLTRIYPLSFPTIDDNGISLFVKESVNNVLNLTFDKYREELEKGRPGFTSEGFAALLKAMNNADIFKIMERDRVNIRTEFDAPILTRKGVINNQYQWQVQVPMTLKFVGQNTASQPMKFYLVATVTRIDTRDKNKGIAISQIVTLPRH